MAAGNFATCLAHTLEFEGGWSNHPSDPGGATMKGVIQARYNEYRDAKRLPRQTVRNITDAELKEIYKKYYWDVVRGDALARGVDLATFDFGVNSGPARANQYLARAIGGPHVETVKKLCGARLAFVRGLGTFSVFGKGWTRRITTIEARGVKMALGAQLPPAEVKKELQKEAGKASTKSKQQGGAATGTGAGTYTLSAADWTGIAIGVIGVCVVGYFIYRSYINRQRANAYQAVAKED